MKNQRGYTLIEILVGVVFVMVILQIGFTFLAASSGNSNISIGINGMTEMRCIDGYRFIIGQDGHIKQVLDEFGKGATCKN